MTRARRSAMDPPGPGGTAEPSLAELSLRRSSVAGPRPVHPDSSMLQIKDLVFDAWGRRFFDRGDRQYLAQGRQGGPRRPQRRRQVDPLQADPQPAASLGSGEIGLPRALYRLGRPRTSSQAPVSRCWRRCWPPTSSSGAARQPGYRRARRPRGHLQSADRDRRRPRALPRRRDPGGPGLFHAGPCSRPMSEFSGGWRMPRGPGGQPVRRAGYVAVGRTHQLPRPGRRALAR